MRKMWKNWLEKLKRKKMLTKLFSYRFKFISIAWEKWKIFLLKKCLSPLRPMRIADRGSLNSTFSQEIPHTPSRCKFRKCIACGKKSFQPETSTSMTMSGLLRSNFSSNNSLSSSLPQSLPQSLPCSLPHSLQSTQLFSSPFSTPIFSNISGGDSYMITKIDRMLSNQSKNDQSINKNDQSILNKNDRSIFTPDPIPDPPDPTRDSSGKVGLKNKNRDKSTKINSENENIGIDFSNRNEGDTDDNEDTYEMEYEKEDNNDNDDNNGFENKNDYNNTNNINDDNDNDYNNNDDNNMSITNDKFQNNTEKNNEKIDEIFLPKKAPISRMEKNFLMRLKNIKKLETTFIENKFSFRKGQ